MQLIARYRNAGFEALADGVLAFFDRRVDLQRPGVAFGPDRFEAVQAACQEFDFERALRQWPAPGDLA